MQSREQNLQEIYTVSALSQRLMRVYMHNSDIALNLGPSEGHLLHYISESQPVNLKELAAIMHLSPGAITQLVESLVQADYVSRNPSEQDRRVAVVTLTPLGAKTMNNMRHMKQKLFANIVTGLTDKEVATYLEIQQKMLAYLETSCANLKKQ
jgi:DNA-binding MarR family transcriptional regulator